ncbi:TPA: 23S rRNA (adenine(2503)-C(2))-methyltransferase RlmN, partial [Candidatus Marinimicrobia bacterium]|nr:23S rRNA (adenine(2503)-C(2))-methyltransferase RlmN [Candidatus Neomarinimicrobiota bacterium]
MTIKHSLKDLLPEEMETWAQSKGYPSYKGRQLAQWIFQKGVDDPDSMHTLPKAFRKMICAEGNLHLTRLVSDKPNDFSQSNKFLFELSDGKFVESVYIPSENRRTVCVSSQVGCALNCTFCQTARMGFQRNLSTGEIVDQVLQIRRIVPEAITNVVFMGMGEPFHNYDSVIQAARILNHESGLNIGARHITVSTAGVVPQILAFAELPYQFKLAVSLNAIRDDLRQTLMPVNRQYPLSALLEAVKFYACKTHRRVTFEYVMMRNVNISQRDADELVSRLSEFDCKLNLIPFNMTEAPYERPAEEEIQFFTDYLQQR